MVAVNIVLVASVAPGVNVAAVPEEVTVPAAGVVRRGSSAETCAFWTLDCGSRGLQGIGEGN